MRRGRVLPLSHRDLAGGGVAFVNFQACLLSFLLRANLSDIFGQKTLAFGKTGTPKLLSNDMSTWAGSVPSCACARLASWPSCLLGDLGLPGLPGGHDGRVTPTDPSPPSPGGAVVTRVPVFLPSTLSSGLGSQSLRDKSANRTPLFRDVPEPSCLWTLSEAHRPRKRAW